LRISGPLDEQDAPSVFPAFTAVCHVKDDSSGRRDHIRPPEPLQALTDGAMPAQTQALHNHLSAFIARFERPAHPTDRRPHKRARQSALGIVDILIRQSGKRADPSAKGHVGSRVGVYQGAFTGQRLTGLQICLVSHRTGAIHNRGVIRAATRTGSQSQRRNAPRQ
jgi:hypothetical protein